MSEAAVNHFKADLRAIQFTLYEHLKVQQVFGLDAFAHISREECDAIIEQCHRFVNEVTGPINGTADRVGCTIESGQVVTPKGFKDAWKKLFELGLMGFPMPVDDGGLGGPHAIAVVLEELQSGANCAFNMYPGLTHGAADVISSFALPEDRERFLPPMVAGRFAGTMCLSEPHAGSDVGASKTRAKHLEGNVYSIKGTKCWISAGDHDLADNIIHLVLARIEGAPAGTGGISLFIVPKVWVNDDGSLGEPNDVQTASIEHKLGIRASATAVLAFGENDGCRGILVGGKPHMGMKQMFRMMNGARIAVGVQGLSVASSAYLNALSYARERLQGSSVRHFKDPNSPRVPIIEHSDVRRMLLEMKAKVEGMRTLCIKLALHADLAHGLHKVDESKALYHQGQVDLLTPIVKAYCSDQSFRVAELAIQTYGGAGYVQDNPVEQYCRDAKIFSIYEGTNHIQALDLVGRKLPQNGGTNLQAFLGDVARFVAANDAHPVLGPLVKTLARAQEAVGGSAMRLLTWSQTGKLAMVPLAANRFLEMVSELAVGWLLLEGARIASDALAALPDGDAGLKERHFYEGKIAAGRYYARNVLATVPHTAELLGAEDTSPVDLAVESFATI